MNIKTFVVGPVSTNCYVIYDDNGTAAIVDPGDNAPELLAFIDSRGLQLQYIFLTHGHFDHIMAVSDVKDAIGAKVVISTGDAEFLSNPTRSLAGRVGMTQKPVTPDFLAEDGSTFTVGNMEFKYLLTPGHTVGSAVILCGDNIFSGDTLFEDDCGRCDLPGGDYAEMLRSLRRLYDLEGDYNVYPGHDVSTILSRERKHNINMLEAVEKRDI